MKWTAELAELRDAIAAVCQESMSIRRYVSDAGWPVERMTFSSGSAVNKWHTLFEEALDMDDHNIIRLTDILLRDFERNSRLTSAIARYRASLEVPRAPSHAASVPPDALTPKASTGTASEAVSRKLQPPKWLDELRETLEQSDFPIDPTSYAFALCLERLEALLPSIQISLNEFAHTSSLLLAPGIQNLLDACSLTQQRLKTFVVWLEAIAADPEVYQAEDDRLRTDLISAVDRVTAFYESHSKAFRRRA